MIDKSLLDKLVCPVCHQGLNFRKNNLLCTQCQLSFEIKKDMIDFRPEQFLTSNNMAASWKRLEIEQFDDLDSYQELMSRPYFQYLKTKIKQYFLSLDLKDRSILEAGAGRSIFAAHFPASNKVFLTDINRKLLSQNESKYFLIVADAENLPFGDGSFDLVYTIGLIHHLPNQLRGLNELKRIAKTDGRIFISEPTKWSLNLPYYLVRRLLLKILGPNTLKKMIGCGTPYESFIDLNKVAYTFREWNIRKKYLLPFRLPPIKILDRMSWPITVNKFLEKVPLIKRLGTIVFLDILPPVQDRGYGTAYEKFILKGLFKKLVDKYQIKSVYEFPANELMGSHQEIFADLGVEITKDKPDLIWNFCEFDYARPIDFLKEMRKINAKYFAIITQNNKNIGVLLHRLYHLILGHNWNHGKIKNMSYKKVIDLFIQESDLVVEELQAFDAPWFILDVYESGLFIKKILPHSLSQSELKPSFFESWPFSLKKFLSHHFLILIKRA